MNASRSSIRFVLLITAIIITTLITLFALPKQLVTLNTLGNSAINSAPAIKISLAGTSDKAPGPAPAATPSPDKKAEPAPQAEPEPEPEPEIVTEPTPKPKAAPAPTPVPKQPAHSSKSTAELANTKADATTEAAAGLPSQNNQVELNAGTSNAVDSYLSKLSRHLSRFYEYPRRARRLGQEGVPVVVFRFRRNGSLVEYFLKSSSGHELLDKAAQDMLKQAEPLPPVPANMAGQEFSYALPIRFSLR